jgi:hypothetical protein
MAADERRLTRIKRFIYDKSVRQAFALVSLGCGICAAQNAVEIRVPPEVRSETLFIRYALSGETLGGWVERRAGVSSYVISTMRGSHPANEIKAVLYAPGCGIRTFDIYLFAKNEQYSFVCQPLGTVSITGRLVPPDQMEGREIAVEARYMARWAQAFLGVSDDLPVAIPVATADLAADGRFRLTVPDLAKAYDGEIQIWAKNKGDGSLVAQLVPNGFAQKKTRMGGLKIQSEYPSDMVFSACVGVERHVSGFAIRDTNDCDR